MRGNNTFVPLVDVKRWTMHKEENISGQKGRDGKQLQENQVVWLLLGRDICQILKPPVLGTELPNHLYAYSKLILVLNFVS